MAKRVIGIHIGSDAVHAVQLLATRGGLYLECGRTQPVDDGASAKEGIAEALRTLLKGGGFRVDAPASAALPSGSAFFMTLESDLPQLAQVRRVLKFELEDDFPLPADKMVVDICEAQRLENGRTAVLAVAAEREVVSGTAGTLEAVGLECAAVDVEPCALASLQTMDSPSASETPSVSVYIQGDSATIALAQGGRLLNARSIVRQGLSDDDTRVTQEIELMWRETLNHALPSSVTVALAGDEGSVSRMRESLKENLPCDCGVLDPFSGIACSDESLKDPRLAVAVGMAVRAAEPARSQPDLLHVDAREAEQYAGMRKALVTLAALLIIMAAAYVANLYVNLGRLENRNREIASEMRHVFLETVPEETAIIDARSQLDERLRPLREEYSTVSAVASRGVSPLGIVQRISAGIPPRLNIRVSEIYVAQQSVRLKGTADSYTNVDMLRDLLAEIPEFETVTYGNIDTSRGSGAVRFNLNIKLASRR